MNEGCSVKDGMYSCKVVSGSLAEAANGAAIVLWISSGFFVHRG